jgi:hypothetical protein
VVIHQGLGEDLAQIVEQPAWCILCLWIVGLGGELVAVVAGDIKNCGDADQ